MSDPVVRKARARLRKFKGRYPQICEQTGLGYSWLSKFARGVRGENPSFGVISKLLEGLDKLEAADAATRTSRGAQRHG